MGSPAQAIGLWVAALLTLVVLSYIIGENPLFRLAQYLLVGVAAGYAAAWAWRQVLAPRIVLLVRDPGSAWPYGLMLALGALMLARGWRPTARLAGLPLALLLGVGAAVAIGGSLRGTLVPQLAASMVSVAPADYGGGVRGWAAALDAAFMLLSTVAVLVAYRYRTVSPHSPKLWRWFTKLVGRAGRGLITIVLATLLAGAALSFFSALRGQVDWLLFEWLGTLFRGGSG